MVFLGGSHVCAAAGYTDPCQKNKQSSAETVCMSYQKKRAAALTLFDQELGLFVSGKDRQVSWMSQVWMIFAKAVDEKPGEQFCRPLKRPKTLSE